MNSIKKGWIPWKRPRFRDRGSLQALFLLYQVLQLAGFRSWPTSGFATGSHWMRVHVSFIASTARWRKAPASGASGNGRTLGNIFDMPDADRTYEWAKKSSSTGCTSHNSTSCFFDERSHRQGYEITKSIIFTYICNGIGTFKRKKIE